MRRFVQLSLIALPLALSGCGIPGLVAHGVKSYENKQDNAQAQPAGQSTAPSVQPVATQAPPSAPPPPSEDMAPPPPRTSVTVEKLQ